MPLHSLLLHRFKNKTVHLTCRQTGSRWSLDGVSGQQTVGCQRGADGVWAFDTRGAKLITNGPKATDARPYKPLKNRHLIGPDRGLRTSGFVRTQWSL